MMQIGWIDFSNNDQAKVYDVLNMFKEKGAVDELGFGPLRDSFANIFFPGTTTVQTRAKYFCREAYVLKKLVEGKYGTDYKKVLAAIDKDEQSYAKMLVENNKDEKGKPVYGIIGVDRIRNPKWLQRKPHAIYWTGLRDLGIFSKNMNLEAFAKDVCRYWQERQDLGSTNKNDDGEEADLGEKNKYYDVIKLPQSLGEEELNCTSIKLTKKEASFLKERIITQCQESLFAYILKNFCGNEGIYKEGYKVTTSLDQGDSFEILYNNIKEDLPEELEKYMYQAKWINKLVYLARVRYNFILEKRRNEVYHQGKAELTYFEKLWKSLKPNLSSYLYAEDNKLAIDIKEIFESLGLIREEKLKAFCISLQEDFLNIAHGIETADTYDRLDDLIIKREVYLKGPKRAKLKNPPAGDNQIGDLFFDYRLWTARRMLKDIAEPL